MDEPRMRGPLLKVERANHHIRQLEEAFARYVEANLKSMRRELNEDTGKFEPAILGLPLPDDTALMIGDAIHNLRVSLDHAYWITVENNGGVWADKIKFPFFRDRPSAEGSIKGQPPTARPRRTVLDYIFGEVQPFPNGKLSLYDLHRLDITDKHQLLLPTKIQLPITATEWVIFRGNGVVNDINIRGDGLAKVSIDDDRPMFSNDFGPVEYTGNLESALVVLFGEGPLGDRGVLDELRMLSKNCYSTIISLAALLV